MKVQQPLCRRSWKLGTDGPNIGADLTHAVFALFLSNLLCIYSVNAMRSYSGFEVSDLVTAGIKTDLACFASVAASGT